MIAAVVTIGMVLPGSAAGAQQVTVERRGDAASLEGMLVQADSGGLTLRDGAGAEIGISWDRVRDIQPRTPQLEPLLTMAEDLWRARQRVERDDTAMAEPILDRLFADSIGRPGETSLVIAEGLLRCRIARGDTAGAVVCALETARLRRSGVTTEAYAALHPVIDQETSLSPYLPPLVPGGNAARRLDRDLDEWSSSDNVLNAMAALYRASATLGPDGVVQAPRELPAASADPAVRGHEGVLLLRRLLETTAGDATAMGVIGRDSLRRDWRGAWASFFSGVNLLGHPEVAVARRGVVRLLGVPAGHAGQQPWLAGVSLFVAEHAMRRLGDGEAAEILRLERRDTFPHHPLNVRERLAG